VRRADAGKDRPGPFLLAAPAAVLLLVFLAGPVLLLVRVSLCEPPVGEGFYQPGTWTLAVYGDLLQERYSRDVWLFTVGLGVGVAALAVLVAYPLALYIHGLPPRGKALALAAVVLPKLASVLVVLYGLELLLGNSGPVNGVILALGIAHEPLTLYHNLTGVVIGETYLIVPYAVFVLVAALGRIDPALVPAARGLGATPWQAFRRVTWPLSRPGLVIAGQLSLIWALGAFLGPLLLGSPEEITLAVEVQKQTFENGNWARGAATAILMLLTLAACLGLYAGPGRLGRLLRKAR
jgi:ABC-type spermidine/putrescine transport system permease subunit I